MTTEGTPSCPTCGQDQVKVAAAGQAMCTACHARFVPYATLLPTLAAIGVSPQILRELVTEQGVQRHLEPGGFGRLTSVKVRGVDLHISPVNKVVWLAADAQVSLAGGGTAGDSAAELGPASDEDSKPLGTYRMTPAEGTPRPPTGSLPRPSVPVPSVAAPSLSGPGTPMAPPLGTPLGSPFASVPPPSPPPSPLELDGRPKGRSDGFASPPPTGSGPYGYDDEIHDLPPAPPAPVTSQSAYAVETSRMSTKGLIGTLIKLAIVAGLGFGVYLGYVEVTDRFAWDEHELSWGYTVQMPRRPAPNAPYTKSFRYADADVLERHTEDGLVLTTIWMDVGLDAEAAGKEMAAEHFGEHFRRDGGGGKDGLRFLIFKAPTAPEDGQLGTARVWLDDEGHVLMTAATSVHIKATRDSSAETFIASMMRNKKARRSEPSDPE